jgi:hypothetical protein
MERFERFKCFEFETSCPLMGKAYTESKKGGFEAVFPYSCSLKAFSLFGTGQARSHVNVNTDQGIHNRPENGDQPLGTFVGNVLILKSFGMVRSDNKMK